MSFFYPMAPATFPSSPAHLPRKFGRTTLRALHHSPRISPGAESCGRPDRPSRFLGARHFSADGILLSPRALTIGRFLLGLVDTKLQGLSALRVDDFCRDFTLEFRFRCLSLRSNGIPGTPICPPAARSLISDVLVCKLLTTPRRPHGSRLPSPPSRASRRVSRTQGGKATGSPISFASSGLLAIQDSRLAGRSRLLFLKASLTNRLLDFSDQQLKLSKIEGRIFGGVITVKPN